MYTVSNQDGYAVDYYCTTGIFTCEQAEDLALRINSSPSLVQDLEVFITGYITVTFQDGATNIFTTTNDQPTTNYYTVEIRNNKAAIQATTNGVLTRKQALSSVVQINEWVTFDNQLLAAEVRPATVQTRLCVFALYGSTRSREFHFYDDKAVDIYAVDITVDPRRETFVKYLDYLTVIFNCLSNRDDLHDCDELLSALQTLTDRETV